MPAKRLALISVYDKTGLEDFARRLVSLGFKIISTGKTASFLKNGGIAVEEVSGYTGFPEILEGRVKTLHPKIHAGILARHDRKEDQQSLKDLKIDGIDLVVVNLYPFESTPNIENIDIGGPTLLRAAAKNFETVTVVCDPADYEEALSFTGHPEPVEGLVFRKKMAAKVFALTARHETAIANWFEAQTVDPGPWTKDKSSWSTVHGPRSIAQSLRYGENPHQKAQWCLAKASDAFWGDPLQGKELSYNNILDADAAWGLIREIQNPKSKIQKYGCAIVKHTNPCGVALSEKSAADAFEKALACDSLSAFGGIVAFNEEVDEVCAAALSKIFLEVVLAPAFSRKALSILSAKKNLRLLPYRTTNHEPRTTIRSAGGGELRQDADLALEEPSTWAVKTKRQPTTEERRALQLAWQVVKHVKSNAIVFATVDRTLGIGAGQTSRIDSVEIAVKKMGRFFNINTSAHQHISTIVVSSDAFFPFPDSIEAIAKAGATAIIQPGGSLKDSEVIAAADHHNLAMVFTGIRHFRH